MKVILIAFQVFVLAVPAMCQENSSRPEQLHMTVGSPGGPVTLIASSMDRDVSSMATESILRLRGNVETRTACHYTGPADKSGCKGSVVIHADSAEYNERTGEVRPHGNLRIEPNQEK